MSVGGFRMTRRTHAVRLPSSVVSRSALMVQRVGPQVELNEPLHSTAPVPLSYVSYLVKHKFGTW